MKETVATIAAMVGVETHHSSSSTTHHKNTQKTAKHPAPKKRATQNAKHHQESEDVFPLDDEDLKEF